MIEHILKVYGIDCDNKWIGYFATVLTLFIFSSLIFPVIYVKNFSYILTKYLYKFLILTLCISKIITYFVIKYNSSKYFQLNRKLRKYQRKQLIGELNICIFSIISFCFSIVIALLGVKMYFCESFLTEIYKDFNERMESLPVPSLSLVFILMIYVYSWHLTYELIYIEIKSRYMSIIRNFNNEVVKIATKPNKSILILTQRTILKFIEFQINIKRNVDYLKYGNFIQLVLPIAITVGSISNIECIYYSISFIVIKIGFYLWTMSHDLRIRRAENNLTSNINRWLNPEHEDSDYFETKVLESTVKQFNEQKYINKLTEESVYGCRSFSTQNGRFKIEAGTNHYFLTK